MGGFLQRLHLGLDSLDVIALGSLFQGCSSILYLTLGGSIHLVAQLAQRAAGGVNQVLSLVPGRHFFLLLAVLVSVGLSILHHLLHFLLCKTAVAFDLNCLLVACSRIFSGHMHYSVGINIEGDFNLRYATRRRWNTRQLALAQSMVVYGHLGLTLQNINLNRSLVVLRCGEGLSFAGRDGGIAVQQPGEDAALGLNTQRKGSHI